MIHPHTRQSAHGSERTFISYASTSAVDSLPSLAALQTWAHRPQAVAKAFISDVYALQALVSSDARENSSKDVFLLNRFPCRMVELVGWVAGAERKEKTMNITLDDGDGSNVLPIILRLPEAHLSRPTPQVKRKRGQEQEPTHFISAKERREKKLLAAKGPILPIRKPEKVYERRDIRVGDVVRVVGKVEEWSRKSGGSIVRSLVVEEAVGGSIMVVDPDEQYHHASRVLELHETLYSRPFVMPSTDLSPLTPSQSPIKGAYAADFSTQLSSIEGSSEIGSEASVDMEEIKLCDPARLRASQLTDRTFRQYLLDHMMQETTRLIKATSYIGPEATRQALESLFPEYGQLNLECQGCSGSKRLYRSQFRGDMLSQSNRASIPPSPDSTPTRSQYRPKHSSLEPFTIASLLSVPHLELLAQLVVDEQARREEKRRRRRIRDGIPKTRDLEIELDRTSSGKSVNDYRLSSGRRRANMETLVGWVIRNVASEGSLVQIRLSPPFQASQSPLSYRSITSRPQQEQYGYLPLPEPLLFSLLVPHIQADHLARSSIFLSKGDSRKGSGVVVEDVGARLRRWGEEGRWERVADRVVEEALIWGEMAGYLRKKGRGWIPINL